jgi:hypothetical protein
MSIWVYVAVTMALFYFSIAMHELGHGLACRRCGVLVKEISLLGFPIPGVPALVLPIRSARFPGTRWVIHPLLLGAYMQPDETEMNAVPRYDRLRMLVMGPIASCLTGGLLVAIGALLQFELNLQSGEPSSAIFLAALALIATPILYLIRGHRWFWAVLFLIGLPLTPILIWFIGSEVVELLRGTKSLAELNLGVVGTVKALRDMLIIDGTPATIAKCFTIAGGFSTLIGIANMAPLIAGDGTMMLMELVPVSVGRWIWRTTLAVVLPLLVLALLSDAAWLWTWVRS